MSGAPLPTLLRAAAALLACTACVIVGAPVAGAAQVGVNVAATSGDYFNSPAVIGAIDRSRPAWVRVFMGWNALEPAAGVYNTAELANYSHFLSALPAGTKVDVDVLGTPGWANGGGPTTAPPTNPQDYAAFVNHLANQFRGLVDAWEVWNEEDSPSFWTGTAPAYAALLEAAYPAIKAGAPSATVILGGLTGNDATYLQSLYAAGAHGFFDAVGLHTDTACNIASPNTFEYDQGTQTINQYFFLGFTAVHAVMAAHGDGNLPIDMTELGWSSTGSECQTGAWAGKKLAGVTPDTQATYLQQAYHCLAQPQYSYVQAAIWFELFNADSSSAPLSNFGLLNAGYAPKPAFDAFRQESLHGDQLTGPCGDFAGPTVHVSSPTPGETYRGPLIIDVHADPNGSPVYELTLEHDGKVIRHFMNVGTAGTLEGSIAWQGAKHLPCGTHTITVLAKDRQGNVTSTSVSVVHASAPGATTRRASPLRRALVTVAHADTLRGSRPWPAWRWGHPSA
jgi:Big-like domain-containing protein